MAKDLLVGATFRDAQPDMLDWLDIQLKFLKATTDNFDHVSFVNANSRYSYAEPPGHGDLEAFARRDTTVVGVGEADTTQEYGPLGAQHVNGLNGLLSYFKSRRHDYDYFLFLDSDSFPIRKNWLPLLKEKIRTWKRMVASVVRVEQLELRWHSSVLFVVPAALDLLRFGLDEVEGGDLASLQELDVGIGLFQTKFKRLVFPLIRTNQFNLHPVAYGVYYDMFYHHTFSSRRSVRDGGISEKPFYAHETGRHQYAMHYIDSQYSWDQHTEEFMENPGEFINKLAGWSSTEYAIIDKGVREWKV